MLPSSSKPQLCLLQPLKRAFARRYGLLLAPNAGLLVVLSFAELVHQPSLLTLLLEALQRDFEGLIVLELDAGQNLFPREPFSVLFPGRLSILYADCLAAGVRPKTRGHTTRRGNPLRNRAPAVIRKYLIFQALAAKFPRNQS